MKKKRMGALSLMMGMLPIQAINAQVTVANNTAGAGNYVGWAASVMSDLEIRNNANNRILFFTDGSTIPTNTECRMLIMESNGTSGAANTGRIAMGNALPTNFNARDRLHLHQSTESDVGIKLTHGITGSGAGDGTTLTLRSTRDFQIQQWEENNIELCNLNNAGLTMISRLVVRENGQVLVGNNTAAENPVDELPIGGFSAFGSSLLNVRGPINTCATMNAANPDPTILYGYTKPYGTTDGDGFRMHMDLNFGGVNREALVFEKTDGTNNVPDGYIAFTNTGLLNTEVVSAYIEGTGRMYVGSNVGTQTNRFTIESRAGDASASGLRFVNLTATATPVATNPGAGVLAVDMSGNVIYVPATASGGSGQGFFPCSTVSAAPNLLQDSKLNLNNHNLYFEGNDDLDLNRVGIGYACNNVLPAKLSVHQVYSSQAPANTTAIYGHNSDIGEVTNLTFTGVHGVADGLESTDVQVNRGGFFTASNSSRTIGVEVSLEPSTENDNRAYGGVFNVSAETFDNVGVIGTATGSDTRNVGGAFFGNGTATTRIGVYGEATVATNSYAGYFNGDINVTGTIYNPSDRNLKENIQDYKQANELLSQLHPVSYDFRTREYPQLNLDQSHQIGLISQELEKVLPAAVKETTSLPVKDENGKEIHPAVTFKAVSYEKLIPVLVGGHQEQEAKVVALQAENAKLQEKNVELENQLNELNAKFAKLEACLQNLIPGLCETSQGAIEQNSPAMQQTIAVNLSDKNAIVLNQNVPNPFAESTVITYSVPATVKKAQIHFYDASGKLLNSVEITERGNGKLQVFGSDLSSGTYTYTLVADGEVASSKKLVKQ